MADYASKTNTAAQNANAGVARANAVANQSAASVVMPVRQAKEVDGEASGLQLMQAVAVAVDATGRNRSGLADNRAQAIAQRRLLDTATNSVQAKRLQAVSNIAQNSKRATQLQAISAVMNSSPRQSRYGAVERVVDEEALQAKSEGGTIQREAVGASLKPNDTGLPDHLKSGIESLSGMSMDHVKVHYNSRQPAQLNAHAYAQGSDIHVAPGQERHLPHEAWHVVQQAQGRVQPTMQMKAGVPVNDDMGLETEADVVGAKALGLGAVQMRKEGNVGVLELTPAIAKRPEPLAQRGLQEQAGTSPRVQQFLNVLGIADNSLQVQKARKLQPDTPYRPTNYPPQKDSRTGADPGPVIQRMIGEGSVLWHGWTVNGPGMTSYTIIGSHDFRGELQYKLRDIGGSEILVAWNDRRYLLCDADWMKDFAVAEYEQPYNTIAFTVKRREKDARSRTTFDDGNAAEEVFREQLGPDASSVIKLLTERQDWSYPTMATLLKLVNDKNMAQPGVRVGADTWMEAQKQRPGRKNGYKVTTANCAPALPQLIGYHILEYQETNLGTQGPRQQEEAYRKAEQKFTRSLLRLPGPEVEKHVLGVGLTGKAALYPAASDVKFDDTGADKYFGKPAGSMMFKAYQEALESGHPAGTRYESIHDDGYRKGRTDALLGALEKIEFKADAEGETGGGAVYMERQMGIRRSDSGNALIAVEGWRPPNPDPQISLERAYQGLFKKNVWMASVIKDTSRRLAEEDVERAKIGVRRGEEDEVGSKRNRASELTMRNRKVHDRLAEIAKSEAITAKAVTRIRTQAVKKLEWVEEALTTYGDGDESVDYGNLCMYEVMLEGFLAAPFDIEAFDPFEGVGKKKILGLRKKNVKKRKRERVAEDAVASKKEKKKSRK